MPEKAKLEFDDKGGAKLSVTSASESGPVGGRNNDFVLLELDANVQGPGFSLGNSGGWSNAFAEVANLNVARRGITQLRGGQIQKHAVGDIAHYHYVRTDGGATAESDEGASGITAQMCENEGYFHGRVASTAGRGDTAPVLAFTSGNRWTTDGAFLLNISKGTIAGNLNGPSTNVALPTASGPIACGLKSLPVTGVTLPLSTAIGIATAGIGNPGVTADHPVPVPVAVRLCRIGQDGTVPKPFTVGSVVSVAGPYPEQSIVLAAVMNPDGTQTLTLMLRNPNWWAVIFQGGVQGQFLSFDANLAFSGMRSSYFCFGSLTGTDLIYGFQTFGSLANGVLPQQGAEAATISGPNAGFHLYPGAEIVCNRDQGYNCTLEHNGVHWAPGDIVENPHNPCFAGGAAFFVHQQTTPSFQGGRTSSLFVLMKGKGIGGAGTSAIRVVNNNPAEHFTANGGPISPPAAMTFEGHFEGFYFSNAPDGGTVFFIQNPSSSDSKHLDLVNLDWNEGGRISFDSTEKIGVWRMERIDASEFSTHGAPGASGSFRSADGKTVTVVGGLITSIA